MKAPAVYMLASQRNGTLYIGVTSDLVKRIWQHREGVAEGFTGKYGVKMLVWYEQHESMESAISREKALKKWRRQWKLAAIEQLNPDWVDLWPAITGEVSRPVVPAQAGTQSSKTQNVAPAKAGAQSSTNPSVAPANAGAQTLDDGLDSRLHGNDDPMEGVR